MSVRDARVASNDQDWVRLLDWVLYYEEAVQITGTLHRA